jgi:hypothetical protein
MDIKMSDGRQIRLTKLARLAEPPIPHGEYLAVWQAEAVYPRRKFGGAFIQPEHGYGGSMREAVAQLYDKLDDAGELEDDLLPCTSCGKGYRLISVVSTYVEHDDKCPAMKDGDEDD